MQSTNSAILIYVSVPRGIALKAWIDPQSPSKVLHRLFPGHQMIFLYQGQMMQDSIQFHVYNVQAHTTIVAVVKNDTNAIQMKRYLQLSADNDEYDPMMKTLMNVGARKEMFRLKDIVLLKREIRDKRSFGTHIVHSERPIRSSLHKPTQIGYAAPCEPSVDPLPFWWNE
jgi:hypothetical protein